MPKLFDEGEFVPEFWEYWVSWACYVCVSGVSTLRFCKWCNLCAINFKFTISTLNHWLKILLNQKNQIISSYIVLEYPRASGYEHLFFILNVKQVIFFISKDLILLSVHPL